jgi:hypothetical protein
MDRTDKQLILFILCIAAVAIILLVTAFAIKP